MPRSRQKTSKEICRSLSSNAQTVTGSRNYGSSISHVHPFGISQLAKLVMVHHCTDGRKILKCVMSRAMADLLLVY